MKTAQPPSQTPYRGASATAQPLSLAQDRNMATAAHLGGVLGAIPAGLIYYLYRGRAPFAEQEAREALDFALLPTLLLAASILLSNLPQVGWFFGVTAALTWTFLAASALVAGIRVSSGNPYRYRFNSRLFSRLLGRKK